MRTLRPQAPIFVVTLPTLYGNEAFSAQIRAMAEIFDNIYVLDLERYAGEFSAPEFKERYFLMGHMNAAGYQYMAWLFLTYINWHIERNLPAFSAIALQ